VEVEDMIKFEVDTREARKKAEVVARALGDLAPAMKEIGEALLGRWQRGWRKEHDPYRQPWKPLSPVTIARRRKGKGKGRPKILANMGTLQQSFVYAFSQRRVEWGTEVVYAPTHQFGARKGQYGKTKRGAPIPWGDVPKRMLLPFEGLWEGDWDLVVQVISRHVMKEE